MYRYFLSFIFILGFVIMPQLRAAPRIENFPTLQYGFHSRNLAVVQDDRGVMYFANAAGVVEFDSRTRRLISLPEGVGAYSLAKGPEGRIFVGGMGEIGYLEAQGKGTMGYRSLKDALPMAYQEFQGPVIKVQVTASALIFITDNLLVILKNKKTETSMVVGGAVTDNPSETDAIFEEDAPVLQYEPAEVFTSSDHFFTFLYHQEVLYILDGERGVLMLNRDQLVPIPGGSLLRAHVMLPYKDNTLLLVTPQGGPVVFDPSGRKKIYRLPFAGHSFFKDNLITCGVYWGSDRIALGSINKGVLIVEVSQWKAHHIHQELGLADDHIYGLYVQGSGDLWLALEKGVSMLPGDDRKFSALIRGCQVFSNDEVIFDGVYYDLSSRIPLRDQPHHQQLIFPYNANALRFTFTSNQYRQIDKMQYQSYLEGLDNDWTSWTSRGIREYTNLDWGSYTLRVRCKNSEGEEGGEARYSFYVKPPWHETWWFMLTQIVFILGILVLSRIVEESGGSKQLSEYLVTFILMLIYRYLVVVVIAPVIGKYSNGIVFFKALFAAFAALLLKPSQKFIKKMLEHIGRKKA
jgi:Y_Y_Y domain